MWLNPGWESLRRHLPDCSSGEHTMSTKAGSCVHPSILSMYIPLRGCVHWTGEVWTIYTCTCIFKNTQTFHLQGTYLSSHLYTYQPLVRPALHCAPDAWMEEKKNCIFVEGNFQHFHQQLSLTRCKKLDYKDVSFITARWSTFAICKSSLQVSYHWAWKPNADKDSSFNSILWTQSLLTHYYPGRQGFSMSLVGNKSLMCT